MQCILPGKLRGVAQPLGIAVVARSAHDELGDPVRGRGSASAQRTRRARAVEPQRHRVTQAGDELHLHLERVGSRVGYVRPVSSLDHHALLARTPRRVEVRLQRRVGRGEVDARGLAQLEIVRDRCEALARLEQRPTLRERQVHHLYKAGPSPI